MNKFLKIKCPTCGAVLAAKNKPGLEKKIITCPVCKNKAPFKSYKTISSQTQMEETVKDIIINIKCPSCSTVIPERIRDAKDLTFDCRCPVCYHKAPFYKFNHYDTGDITISPETEMVGIYLLPHHERRDEYPFVGTYQSFITSKAIIPNIIKDKSCLPMPDFPRFLKKLNHLLNLYVKKVPYYNNFDDGTCDIWPSELIIELYDKDLKVYEKLWIKGDYRGNIVCDVDGIQDYELPDFLEKEIRKLVPQIDEYIIGPDFVHVDDDYSALLFRNMEIMAALIKKGIDQYVEEQGYLSNEPTAYGPPTIDDSKDHGE